MLQLLSKFWHIIVPKIESFFAAVMSSCDSVFHFVEDRVVRVEGSPVEGRRRGSHGNEVAENRLQVARHSLLTKIIWFLEQLNFNHVFGYRLSFDLVFLFIRLQTKTNYFARFAIYKTSVEKKRETWLFSFYPILLIHLVLRF